MLIHEGATRTLQADRHLAWSLAAIAGALNTAGFYAAGLYSSNMTGNVSALADHLGMGDLVTGSVYLALITTFISGAVLSTLLINIGRRRHVIAIYALSILAEALLLLGLGCAELWLPGQSGRPLLAFGLSFVMGHQNAVVTRISDARVRTTHVTGMVTDIGIELANLADANWRKASPGEITGTREKLRLHGFTVLSFLAGGVVGVLAYKEFSAYLLFGAAAVLLLLAYAGIAKGRLETGRPLGRRTGAG